VRDGRRLLPARRHVRSTPGDTAGLERLLRYILRPGVCPERISRRDDGRVVLAFRKPDPSGRTAWITGVALLRRLAALIPPRRAHGITYHGVFGSAHRVRSRVIATARASDHLAFARSRLMNDTIRVSTSAGPRLPGASTRKMSGRALPQLIGNSAGRCDSSRESRRCDRHGSPSAWAREAPGEA
jgi:hypothetical protein